jgi:hypothetical protein
MPLTKDALAPIIATKMQCLAISLTLNLDCLISCKKTHIQAITSFVAIATFGGKKKNAS